MNDPNVSIHCENVLNCAISERIGFTDGSCGSQSCVTIGLGGTKHISHVVASQSNGPYCNVSFSILKTGFIESKSWNCIEDCEINSKTEMIFNIEGSYIRWCSGPGSTQH
eukprot:UN34657